MCVGIITFFDPLLLLVFEHNCHQLEIRVSSTRVGAVPIWKIQTSLYKNPLLSRDQLSNSFVSFVPKFCNEIQRHNRKGPCGHVGGIIQWNFLEGRERVSHGVEKELFEWSLNLVGNWKILNKSYGNNWRNQLNYHHRHPYIFYIPLKLDEIQAFRRCSLIIPQKPC